MKQGALRLRPYQVIAGGFLLLILLGAALLSLPFASRAEGTVPFGDCLFTATSAVCVTGLIVRDTATTWTPFGQAVLLLLIQIGGMGVVTMALMLSFFAGRKIGLMQRVLMRETIAAPQVGGIVRLTRFILLSTAAIEGAGALLLLPVFWRSFGFARGLWYALFHAVSAFCNAGFDLMGVREPFSSVTSYAQNPLLNLTLILLITLGGLGFLVWEDLRANRWHWKHYRMQTKVVLVTSLALLLIPAIGFYLLELREYGAAERILPALFQSVTLRTAGFNSVDLNSFSDAGKVTMILWMLVGGSPGSTAGGLKTTTLAVLLLSAASVIRRREQTQCFGRRVPEETVRQAAALLVIYLALFLSFGMVISRVEGLPLLTCLFETASAVGTVGITLGITPGLGGLSRALLMLLMFFGRAGALTLIYAAQPFQRVGAGRLPEEKMTVG